MARAHFCRLVLCSSGVGLLQFAALPTVASGLLAATLFGLATPISLSLAGVTLLAQRTGQDARRNIAIMMLFIGLSAGVFWPIASTLDAAANLCLALPLYLGLALGVRPRYRAVQTTSASVPVAPILDGKLRRRAQWLMAIAFSLQGFGARGLPLQLISLFAELGVPTAAAVGIAALTGPATPPARLAEIALAGRLASGGADRRRRTRPHGASGRVRRGPGPGRIAPTRRNPLTGRDGSGQNHRPRPELALGRPVARDLTCAVGSE